METVRTGHAFRRDESAAQARNLPTPAWRRRKPRRSTYIWIAAGMNLTMVFGFWGTYFDPMLRGVYPEASPLLHLHGWTFFAWYPLLLAQTALVGARRIGIHRMLGWSVAGLAPLMIGVGLIVSAVRVHLTMKAGGDPFWDFMGLPIFSIWVLFTIYLTAAILRRRRTAEHKRFMVLASAVALSAGTTRIVFLFVGFSPWSAAAGMLASLVFVIVAMMDDIRGQGRIHPVYAWGAMAMVCVIGGACLLVMTPGGDIAKLGVAWLGGVLRPLY
jgi:hypothetical protein